MEAEIISPEPGTAPVFIELSDTEPLGDGIYETNCDGFAKYGVYKIYIRAVDDEGYTSPRILTTVDRQSAEPNSDSYEPDNFAFDTGVEVLNMNEIQNHNFHTSEDADWIWISLVEGEAYTMTAKPADPEICRPYIEIFKWNGIEIVPVGGVNYTEPGDVYWTCTQTGAYYYAKISNQMTTSGVSYELTINRPAAGIHATVYGTVRKPSGSPISRAFIHTGGGGTTLTRENGTYSLTDSAETHTVTIQADGYETYAGTVTLTEDDPLMLNIILVPTEVKQGDVNGDDDISLKDALLALKIISGKTDIFQSIPKKSDVNEDGRIGLEEAVYVLQCISE